MSWKTTASFKLAFAAAKNATTDQLEMAYAAAEDDLVDLVGQAAVDDAKLLSPTDTVKSPKVIRAHSFLAVSFVYFNVENIKREQSPGSPGMPGLHVTDERFTPKELKELSDQYRAMALKAIAPYVIGEVEGDEYGNAVEFCHPTVINCKTDACA